MPNIVKRMSKQAEKYILDKTIFRAMGVEEADGHVRYWKAKTLQERLNAACYLLHQFYGTTPQTPIDKTDFAKRKHAHLSQKSIRPFSGSR